MAESKAISYARQNRERFLEQLKDLLRIPSISTLPENKDDVRRAAKFVADDLTRSGMENVEIIETSGHPLVYADWLNAPGKPTVLCYGHYDVQPPDPLEEWKTPPFEPEIRNDNIYARGAVDDKGQMFMHLKAFESLLKTEGRLPVNVRVLIEGEEEVGGESIEAYVKEHPERLGCDVALVSDTEMFAPETPTLTVGLRGLCYVEVKAQGPMTDLHSGSYGGASPNPFVALAQIIAKLKDESGKILIPGFYDKVKAPTEAELKAWESLPFDEEHYRKTEVGSTVLTGEPGYSVLYRTWARPTLDVHGMPGGFTGAGAKTVIPARASAKISMRLVPDQDPNEVLGLFKDYVKSIAPEGIHLEVEAVHGAEPVVVNTDNPFVKVSADAMREIWGKETVYIRTGGSIPIVAAFEKSLKVPSLLMGFGLPDDGIHGPNEKFHIPNFYRGIDSLILFFERLAES
ncbi:MAG: dipeptidase [Acidobacteriota bacterium]|jgi:acetylornithine deacetylase/succinyl-diaminopimelate desuccinylase-like protein